MAEYLVKLNDPIILGLQIADGNVNKFVRAYVKDEDNNIIAGSPYNLTHQSNGWYQYMDIPNLVFPSGIKQIRVTYVVFDDAAYTIESDYYLRDVDVYREDLSGGGSGSCDLTDVVTKLDQIITSLAAVASGVELEGIVVEDDLVGVVDDEEIIGNVIDDSIEGVVEEETEIIGIASDSSISGTIGD